VAVAEARVHTGSVDLGAGAERLYDRLTLPRTLRFPVALTAFALGGWIASALAMQGMASMDGPGSIGSFLWLWKVTPIGGRAPAPVALALLGAAVWIGT
jgi:phosphate/sulfate permease